MPIPALLLPALIGTLNLQDADASKLMAAKDWAGMEALARTRIAAKPKDGVAHNLLGIALGNQGKTKEAREAFAAAVAADGKLAQAWFNLLMADSADSNGPGTRKAFAELRKLALPTAAKAADDKLVFQALADPPVPFLEWAGLGKGLLKAGTMSVYPGQAADAGLQGDVVIEVLVDAAGVPTKATMLGGITQVAYPSESMVMKWRFEPKIVDGKAVPSRTKVALAFKIESGICKIGTGPDLTTAASNLQTVAKGASPFR